MAEKKKTLADFKLKPAEIRFVHLYLGGEGGECWNNATRAYGIAYDKNLDVKGQYKVANVEGCKLLAKPSIQEYKNWLLAEHGFTETSIKSRYGALAYQNNNLGVAVAATDRMAKIAGVLRDEGLKVDIPQLTELGDSLKKILSKSRR